LVKERDYMLKKLFCILFISIYNSGFLQVFRLGI
jgi:hypothetical protein